MSSKVKQIHLASESNVRRHFFWFSTLFSADNVGNVLALMFAVSFHSVEQTVISWIRKSLEYENWSTIFTYVFSHFLRVIFKDPYFIWLWYIVGDSLATCHCQIYSFSFKLKLIKVASNGT